MPFCFIMKKYHFKQKLLLWPQVPFKVFKKIIISTHFCQSKRLTKWSNTIQNLAAYLEQWDIDAVSKKNTPWVVSIFSATYSQMLLYRKWILSNANNNNNIIGQKRKFLYLKIKLHQYKQHHSKKKRKGKWPIFLSY